MRSGIEMTDCEKLNAIARPESLKGRPAQSSGFGPAPRSIASSWLIDAQDPDRSISAKAGALAQIQRASARIVLRRIIDYSMPGPKGPGLHGALVMPGPTGP